MRYSQLLAPTLKEAPSEAKVPSHVLLIRGGYIRQTAAGIFSLLPLGLKVIQKINQIVRQELTQIGAQEVLLPMVHPAPLWKESGRWQVYGPQLLRIKDRKGFDFALSPTAEEAMVALIRDEVKTYRKLPLNVYQIQDKFRDEDRPRAGLLRGREFIMKDGYSFHSSEVDAKREYEAMYGAYSRIFQRCGLDYRAVEADTGAIGGTLSHEFQVLADTGEDSLVSCDHCDYAANVEKALLFQEERPVMADTSSTEEIHTPRARSIKEVANFLKIPETQLVKTLIYKADGNPIAVLLRGDHQLNEPKLKTLLQAGELEAATETVVMELTGAEVGSIGPRGLTIPVYADFEVARMPSFTGGANRTDYHVSGLQLGRDFKAILADLRIAAAGDKCGRCQVGQYRFHRGIEVGHVFFLGTKYSAPMHCEFLDQQGQQLPMIMGTYGIGITRTLAAAVEQNHDDQGIIWPLALAPFQVVIVEAGVDEKVKKSAQQLYQSLCDTGVEVLYDDRDERPGVKFKDADLLGIPIRLTIGKQFLLNQQIEVKRRDGSFNQNLGIQETKAQLAKWLQEMIINE